MDEFMSVTGVDMDGARMYLDMTDGDPSAASALYFSMSEGGPATPSMFEGGRAASGPNLALPSLVSELETLVWGTTRPIPSSWREQSLTFEDDLCLPQHKNGPCGVLA